MNKLHLLSYDPVSASFQASLCRLFTDSFGDYPLYYALWREYLADPVLTFVWGREEECPIAHIQVVDYCWRIEGREYPVAYLYAVCTAVEERGQGVMSGCLTTLLEILRGRGYEAVFLQPSSLSLVPYYARFGFTAREGEVRLFDSSLWERAASVIFPGERARRYLERLPEEEREELLDTPWMVCPCSEKGREMPKNTLLLSPLQ